MSAKQNGLFSVASQPQPASANAEHFGLELFERAKRYVSNLDSLMSAEEEIALLKTVVESSLPKSVKAQIGRLAVEHRIFKRGLVHYANPGNYYKDTCHRYYEYDEEGEQIAIEEADLGETARQMLGIADGWPSCPGCAIETAESLIVPYWPHDEGSLFGVPPQVIPEMFFPLEDDVELEHTKMYPEAEALRRELEAKRSHDAAVVATQSGQR